MRRPRRMQTCGQHLDTATVRCASNDLLWYRLHVMYMVRLCYVYVHVMVLSGVCIRWGFCWGNYFFSLRNFEIYCDSSVIVGVGV